MHWKDGRSAKESARSWLAAAPSVPVEISKTLYSHQDIGTLCDWVAEPEAKVRFDNFGGEHSNPDILLTGQDEHGPIVVAVEAKADETFGSPVHKTLSVAQSRFEKNPRSNGVERIRQLCEALFGIGAITGQTDILDLRYQLLTVTAAAMAEAKRRSARRAVVMIHEFVTPCTNDRKRGSNARDLDRFVSRLSGQQVSFKSGMLLGPFRVPGKPIVETDILLYFGKCETGK